MRERENENDRISRASGRKEWGKRMKIIYNNENLMRL